VEYVVACDGIAAASNEKLLLPTTNICASGWEYTFVIWTHCMYFKWWMPINPYLWHVRLRICTLVSPWRSSRQHGCSEVLQIKFLIWRVPSPSSVVQPSHSAQCVHRGGFFTFLCDWQNPSNTVTRLPILKQCNVYMKIKNKAAPS
jgi:hypothetical protein